MAAWQWYNHLEASVPPGKTALRINWDETAICLHQGDKKGNIFLCKGHNAVQQGTKAARRAYVTQVALVCDHPLIQRCLPQVVICNERTLPVKMHAALQARLGGNFVLLRRKTAWVNTDISVEIMRLIAQALQPFSHEWQPVLMLDAYRAHIGARVFNAGVRYKLWLLVVPAGMTWLLQVLDTHVFRSYKACVRNAYQLHCIEQGVEAHGLQLILDSVRDATASVIVGRDWSAAFAGNGFGGNQVAVRPRIKAMLGFGGSLKIVSDRPSPGHLRVCLPRNATLFYNSVWRAVDGLASVVPKAMPAKVVVVSGSSSSSSVGPIASRTRAKAKASVKVGCDCGNAWKLFVLANVSCGCKRWDSIFGHCWQWPRRQRVAMTWRGLFRWLQGPHC